MIKIKLHSLIDLITNSSTEIYTFSSASLQACKNMVDEFFKMSGINKTCDDVFELSIKEEGEYSGPYGEFPPESYLLIKAKDSKYENLAVLIYNFLYSTDHEACYNG